MKADPLLPDRGHAVSQALDMPVSALAFGWHVGYLM